MQVVSLPRGKSALLVLGDGRLVWLRRLGRGLLAVEPPEGAVVLTEKALPAPQAPAPQAPAPAPAPAGKAAGPLGEEGEALRGNA